ncbi:MAG: cold-shock protein [Promethearchaeota archaeon]
MSNQGIVKWFNSRKGFGFIVPDGAEGAEEGQDSNDVFVHYSSIVTEDEGEFKTLYQNDKVTFNLIESEKGREARDVVVTERAPRERRYRRRNREN